MPAKDYRKHEVSFCADVSKWADAWFQTHADLPFGDSDIESFAKGSNKRSDLRFYERKPSDRGKLLLMGEVKLPGTPMGRSAFDPALLQDSYNKATAENCRYFFTWNVEELAMFDRSIWDAPTMHERQVGYWKLGLKLNSPTDVTRAEVKHRLFSEFLPKVLGDVARIFKGERKGDFALAPSDFYIAVLESHLAGPMGPVRELQNYLGVKAAQDSLFDARLRQWMVAQQWNFDRNNPESWQDVVDRAAHSMVYVLSNRILFYQAVRIKTPLQNFLPELAIPKGANTPKLALKYLKARFEDAVEATGDYEPVFFPDEDEGEWSATTALSGANSIEAWRKVIEAVERFQFKEIPTDVLGGVFQKLISPEERHKFGQHYTDENIVDVINAFCVHKANDVVLDPACGSGGFLVRAYYRKQQLAHHDHHEVLEQLYGCDINPFPAHLATLNLAARNISNEENYPRIARKNFFRIRRDAPQFCILPKATRDASGQRERETIELPELDAIVGNPPYVRQELIPKRKEKGTILDQSKEYISDMATRAFPELRLSGQSDLHLYFWPVAAQFLKEGGWFGFLTSSSWLDVRYGFALQAWILQNFRLVAVMESVDEPWFEDARVKTVVAIMQRCLVAEKRDVNLVRFVRFKQPLADILGEREDERQKQEAAERLRDLVLKTKSDYSNDQLRILVKKQGQLWQEGIALGEMFARQKLLAANATAAAEGDELEEDADDEGTVEEQEQTELHEGGYGGGKWGRYLRAPDFYFEIMREFGEKFVRLGEIASIKRGITSGCDAFFMPRNVTNDLLAEYDSTMNWQTSPLMARPKRADVVSGKVIIIEAGDKTLHPIEAKFARPELHSLMNVDRPVVRPEELDRVVLWVNQPLEEIKGTYAYDYIKWGSKQTFASKKSKSVPVPQRSSCAGRELWYDLTGREPGIGFWSKSQQYRHIVAANDFSTICNCNLYDIHPIVNSDKIKNSLIAVLNSTIVGFFKTFYGRYAGTEGNLKTEIVDVLATEIPNPEFASQEVMSRLVSAFEKLKRRPSREFLEDRLRDCHTAEQVREAAKDALQLPSELRQEDRRELDDAVFELLGVKGSGKRAELIEQLYRELTLHNRNIRIVEVQKMEQRRKTATDRVSQMELALDAWEHLEEDWRKPLPVWLEENAFAAKTVELPEGDVRLPAAGNFFEANTLFFGKKPSHAHECASRAEAELLYQIAREGLRGPVSIPSGEAQAAKVLSELEHRLTEGRRKMIALAEERAGTEKLREQVVETLYRWFIQGKVATVAKQAAKAGLA
jgi:hypothetical protein